MEQIPISTPSTLTCKFCDKLFSSENNLKKHLATAKYCIEKRPIIDINNESCSLKCEYCGKIFLQKTNLQRHASTCKNATIVIEQQRTIDELLFKQESLIKTCEELEQSKLKAIEKLEKELEQVKSELETEKDCVYKLEITAEKYKENNQILMLELAHGQGRLIELKTAKPTIQNQTNYVNPKLAKIPVHNIQPLTVEYIKQENYRYTFELFLKGPAGIAEFLEPLIIVYDANDKDAPPCRNYVCTDVTRHKFHIYISSKEWKLDNGASFLTSVFDQLKDQALAHWNKLGDLEKTLPKQKDRNEITTVRGSLLSMFMGILYENSVERDKLLIDVRTYLKAVVNV